MPGGDRERRRRSRPAPVSRGAVKSARARFGRPGGLTICWRSVWIVPASPVRVVVGVELDVVADAVRRPEPDDRRRREQPLVDDPVQQRQRVRVERRARPRPTTGSSRIAGYRPVQLPRREERRPVDPVDELVERVVVDRPHAEERRPRRRRTPVQSIDEPVAARLGDRVPGDLLLARRRARAGRVSYSSRMPAANASRRSASSSDAARRRPPARRRRRGRPGRGSCGSILTAVWVRDVVAPPISSGIAKPSRSISRRDVAHLLERRRDQPGQADQVGVHLARGLEDPRRPGP